MVAYNATLLLGFVNFAVAIGIALLLAAAWITWRDRYPRRTVAVAVIGTVALFFCHLMGLVFFFALIAGHELQWLCVRRARGPMSARIAALVPLAAVPLGLYLMSPLAPLAAETEFSSRPKSCGNWSFRLPTTFCRSTSPQPARSPFSCSAASPRVAAASPPAPACPAADRRLYLATPWAFKGTYFFDTRFMIMLGFLLFGAVLPNRSAPQRDAHRDHLLHAAVCHPDGYCRLCLGRTSG